MNHSLLRPPAGIVVLNPQVYGGNIIASMPGGYASGAAAYTTFRQAISVGLHYIPAPFTDFSPFYLGAYRNASPPSESAFGPVEIAGSMCRVTSETNLTEIGSRVPLSFGGRRVQLLRPSDVLSARPVGGKWPSGWYKTLTYCGRLQSDAQTILGEPGPMLATYANWPQQLYLGGALNTNGVLGSQFNNTDTYSTAIPALVDAGNPTIGSSSGFTPAGIMGRFLDTTPYRPIVVFGDSISTGSNDQARTDVRLSGRGYVLRKLAHNFPVFQASNSGLAVQHLVGNYSYNWRLRGRLVAACEKAYVSLGTNDGATGRTAQQIIDDLSAFCDDLRSLGIVAVYLGTQLCRNSSTDGWKTVENQTETGGAGFNDKMNTVNAAITSGAIPCDGYIENRTAMQTTLTSGKFALSQSVLTTTAASGSTTTVINSTATLVANAHIGRILLIGTQAFLITGNTTSAITVGTAFSGAPSAGTPIEILDSVTDDGVHPTNYGHGLMAGTFDDSLFIG